jgi:thioredoxin 1
MNEQLNNSFDKELENEILGSQDAVLVMFSARWCGPCKIMKPIVEDLAQEFQNQVKFINVDVEEHRQLSSKFMVSNLPTFLIHKDGEKIKRLNGIQDKQVLAQTLSQL